MSSDCLLRRRKRWPLRCWLTRLGIGGLPMCLRLRARNEGLCWGRFRMRDGSRLAPRGISFGTWASLRYQRRGQDAPATAGRMPALRRTIVLGAIFFFTLLFVFTLLFPLLSCSSKADADTLVMLIESSPTNLDPRVGIDAQSERIDNLIFDDLLSRGDDLNVAPGLAERWEIPNPRTYIFHLHRGVQFHDGRPLTSRDVKWTFDSLLQGKIRSTKAAVYRFVEHIDAPDEATVIFHMKEQDATLLWNLSDGAIGIVPDGSGDEVSRHPIGSGPFRFVSAETDREIVVERNPGYWGEPAKLVRVRFAVVPDATTQALELRKGSGDVAINSLTPDN